MNRFCHKQGQVGRHWWHTPTQTSFKCPQGFLSVDRKHSDANDRFAVYWLVAQKLCFVSQPYFQKCVYCIINSSTLSIPLVGSRM